MTRPKLHPHNRKRVAEACNFCRASKKRCSGTVPCAICVRRGIAESCVLALRPRRFRGSRSGPGSSLVLPAQPGNTIQDSTSQAASTTIHVGGHEEDRFDNNSGATENNGVASSLPHQKPPPLAQHPLEGVDLDVCQDERHGSSVGTLCRDSIYPQHAPSPPSSLPSSTQLDSHPRMLLNGRGHRGMATFFRRSLVSIPVFKLMS